MLVLNWWILVQRPAFAEVDPGRYALKWFAHGFDPG